MLRTPLNAIAAALLLSGACGAGATVLVDTGTPDGTGITYAVDAVDWLALRFDLAADSLITRVRAHLTGGTAGDTFALSLYEDGAGVPAALLASNVVTFAGDGWNGASALNWAVGAGHYWIGVEGVDGSFNANGGGVTMPGATAFSSGAGYQAYPGLQFGLRVDGVAASAVPEPAGTALMLAGLVGLAGWRARRAGNPKALQAATTSAS